MVRAPKQPEVGPWAKQKLQALAAYLEFYTKVLKNQPWWRTIYLDAFAGGGQARVRAARQPVEPISLWDEEPVDPEQQEFVNGSPRVALDVANPFDRYVFIDESGARVAELQELAAEYGTSRTVSIRQGSADEQIAWVLQQRISKSTHRGVAFLDPFGAHLSWSSVQALAETGLFEVIVNFPLHMALARLMTNDADVPANWRAQLDRFFGSSDWTEDVYQSSPGLFESRTEKRLDYRERLLARYRKQLMVAFGHVSTAKLIRNTKGAPLYHLLWAGPHRKGLEGADYILRMADPPSSQ